MAESSVAIDGSKFKAVNNRDRNFTAAKMKRRLNRCVTLDPGEELFFNPGPAPLELFYP
jgi:hypothetical protein